MEWKLEIAIKGSPNTTFTITKTSNVVWLEEIIAKLLECDYIAAVCATQLRGEE